jgi:hypothetical protein
VLFQVVLSLEGFAADLASVGDVVAMAALVNHEIVGLMIKMMKTLDFHYDSKGLKKRTLTLVKRR